MVYRKETQMSGFLFVFLFWVFVLSTNGIGGLSAVDKIDDNGFSSTLKTCNFPAVFNFGDSNSDTGGKSAAFYAIGTPNKWFNFLWKAVWKGLQWLSSEELSLAYLRAYLVSLALGSFKNGANFAAGGSPNRKDKGYSPFYLDGQIAQFRQFKARTIDIVNSTQQEKDCKADLPKPEDFSEALYTFDIGQNDLQFARAPIPDILDQIATAVQQPQNTTYYGKEPLDKNGYVISLNDIAQEFNRQLKSKLAQLKANLTGAAFTYVDAYTAKYKLINSAKDQGFVDPLDFCCQ
ncbi:hypothetical protein MKX03_026085 [Papaver bracteatum]|nr:hypothetical protein MKX03_026085 [Papaver bracteatum]